MFMLYCIIVWPTLLIKTTSPIGTVGYTMNKLLLMTYNNEDVFSHNIK